MKNKFTRMIMLIVVMALSVTALAAVFNLSGSTRTCLN